VQRTDGFFDGFERDGGRHFSRHVASHPVGHDQEAVIKPESVFVDLSDPSDIAGAADTHRLHLVSNRKRVNPTSMTAPGLRRTSPFTRRPSTAVPLVVERSRSTKPKPRRSMTQ